MLHQPKNLAEVITTVMQKIIKGLISGAIVALETLSCSLASNYLSILVARINSDNCTIHFCRKGLMCRLKWLCC